MVSNVTTPTLTVFRPPAGKANLNLFAMARPSLRQPLFEVFYRAARQKETITLDEVPLNTTPDQAVRITVEPLAKLGIYTRNDHTALSDRVQDLYVPVAFH